MRTSDEIEWSTYNNLYRWEMHNLVNNLKHSLFVGDWEIDSDNELLIRDNIHENWREIYTLVHKLKPNSIFECGFGGCYHLKNIHTIRPEAKISGVELLRKQMSFGIELSDLPDHIVNNLMIADFSKDISHLNIPKHEFVYTQAVVMHLSTEKAVNFLKNMASISSKYIFLVEGMRNHENYYDLVKGALPNHKFEFIHNHLEEPVEFAKNKPEVDYTCCILLTKED